MVKENKFKKVGEMKSSEIIDELNEDLPEDRYEELDNELESRYPFSYYFKTGLEDLEEEIKKLKKLLNHSHLRGEVVVSI